MSTDIAVALPKLLVTADTVALTIARLREFVKSGVSDASLQILVDAAYLAIDDCIGPVGDVREQFNEVPGDLIQLSIRAESITLVEENARYIPLVLDSTDYELSPSGRILRRLWTGNHPIWQWWGRVVVTYQPFDTTATRARAAVELVKLDIAFNPALTAQSIGLWREDYANRPYADQRQDILASLGSSRLPI